MITANEGKAKIADAKAHFEEELKKLRTGRPSPVVFAAIEVEAYGSKSRLDGVASINIVDATLVTVQPWDKTLVEDVAKGINAAGMGYNAQVDGDLIRIPIPTLTQEKREEMVKQLNQITEDHKIQVRVIRKDVMAHLDNEAKEGNMSEDEKKAAEKSFQDDVDKANGELDELASSKEKALMSL